MACLYVVEPGAVVSRSGQSLIVEKDGQQLLEVELAHLDSVLVLNTVSISTPALCALLQAGVETAFLTAQGRLLGQLTPPSSRNLLLRRSQYDKERDPTFALRQSRALLAAKLENQRQVLIRHASDSPGPQLVVEGAAEALAQLAPALHQAANLPALLGVEGRAAARYWQAFREMLKAQGFCFPGRRAHPPPDPVNAVLSFGYTLVTNLLTSLLDAYGFDPWLGFLHSETYGHPSLALDLVEVFRAPVVDRLALRLFNLRILQPRDFSPHPEGGVRMCDEALRRFFREWERTLAHLNLREALKAQIEQLARVYRGSEEEIRPWRWSARQGPLPPSDSDGQMASGL